MPQMHTRPGRHRALRGSVVALITLIAAPAAIAQNRTQGPSQGQALYQVHCAACHGLEGRGNGPMASTMRRQPPDLTKLSATNSGHFPDARVRRIVDGRDVESHGTRDMPVWGDVFKTSRDNITAGDPASRILAIVRYLESLQQRDAQ